MTRIRGLAARQTRVAFLAGRRSVAGIGARRRGLTALAWLALVGWASAQALVVEDWSSTPVSARGVPFGWHKLADSLPFLERQIAKRLITSNYDLEVVSSSPGRALHLVSAGDHSIIVKDLSGLDLGRTPLLEWMWRVDVAPRDADLSSKERSDSAAEIHLVWRAAKRTIGYAWGETLPVQVPLHHPRRGQVQLRIATSGRARPGEWV